MLFGAKHFLSILTLILKYKGKHLNDVFQILRNYLLFYFNTKSLFDFIYKMKCTPKVRHKTFGVHYV